LAARQAPSRASSNPNFLYAGTGVGLYASEDSGATWSPTNEGPTNCSVDDLFWTGRFWQISGKDCASFVGRTSAITV